MAIIAGVWLGACSLFGIRAGTEEPRYTVLGQVGQIEIRQYGARVAATTTLQASGKDARYQGFEILAGYIFGGNHARQSIAMTAPVAETPAGSGAAAAEGERLAMTAPVGQSSAGTAGTTITFYMPASLSLARLPVPEDPRIVLTLVPAETYAVLRFSGERSSTAIARRLDQLMQRLAGSPWEADGTPIAWFYDPPWTIPFLRRNEVAIPVRKRP